MYISGKKVDLNLGGNNCSRPCHNTHGLVGIAQEDVLTYSVTVEPLPGIGSKQIVTIMFPLSPPDAGAKL